MNEVLFIFGTRPEAIKLLPVILELKKYSDDIRTVCCTTGQHRALVSQMLAAFDIKTDVDLDIMTEKQSLTHITTASLNKLEHIFSDMKPTLAIVQGDTSSAFAAGLAAYYAKVPVWHIEAGLRTYDPYQPFPEENNRRMLTVLAEYHLAPTESARKNLLSENIPEETILVTGNTVIDMLHIVLEKAETDIRKKAGIQRKDSRLILVTAHRRENLGKPLENICAALKKLAVNFPDIDVVMPVHPNPSVREIVYRRLGDLSNVFLVEPLDYITFVVAMRDSYIILTDSGGVQEEAPSLGKPVLVLRNKTERPEAVEAGTVKLVGSDPDAIFQTASGLLNDKNEYSKMANAVNPYGDGKASPRIVNAIRKRMNLL